MNTQTTCRYIHVFHYLFICLSVIYQIKRQFFFRKMYTKIISDKKKITLTFTTSEN